MSKQGFYRCIPHNGIAADHDDYHDTINALEEVIEEFINITMERAQKPSETRAKTSQASSTARRALLSFGDSDWTTSRDRDPIDRH